MSTKVKRNITSSLYSIHGGDNTDTRKSTIKKSTQVNRNSIAGEGRGSTAFFSFVASTNNSISKKNKKAIVDDKVERAFQKLHTGLKVIKVGRKGKERDVKIQLSKNNYFLHWTSQLLSFKFGRSNKLNATKILRFERGQNTEAFKACDLVGKSRYESRSISIIYTTKDGQDIGQTLDLIMASEDDVEALNNVIVALISKVKQERENLTPDKLFLIQMWNRADVDGDNQLEEKEVYNLLSSLNIHMNRNACKKLFMQFDKDKSGMLDFNEFTSFVEKLRERPEFKTIWSQIMEDTYNGSVTNTTAIGSITSGGNNTGGSASPRRLAGASAAVGTDNQTALMNENSFKKAVNVQEFIDIWRKHQKEDLVMSDVVHMVKKNLNDILIHPKDIKIGHTMFTNLICSEENDVFDIKNKGIVYQDMNQPLTHYFIASSHNTYLEGNQYNSNSSVKRYIDDLLMGCRCVELDCWNGSMNDNNSSSSSSSGSSGAVTSGITGGEPIIYHGHTLTSKIAFRDVIMAVREYGFRTSPYPIILSIENHCDETQQSLLASIMLEILGNMLFIPDSSFIHQTVMPSPEDLKFRVLIKGKRLEDKHFIIHELKEGGTSGLLNEESLSPLASPRSVYSSHGASAGGGGSGTTMDMSSSTNNNNNNSNNGINNKQSSSKKFSFKNVFSFGQNKSTTTTTTTSNTAVQLQSQDSGLISSSVTNKSGGNDADKSNSSRSSSAMGTGNNSRQTSLKDIGKENNISTSSRIGNNNNGNLSNGGIIREGYEEEEEEEEIIDLTKTVIPLQPKQQQQQQQQMMNETGILSSHFINDNSNSTAPIAATGSGGVAIHTDGTNNIRIKNAEDENIDANPALSSLTTLGTSKVHSFSHTQDGQRPCGSCSSFTESKILKFSKAKTQLDNWIAYNMKYFSRTYPAGARLDSSNYDPGAAWAAGAQLVALNYQTKDTPMHLNMGKFRENGNCGYVLKPEYLLSPSATSGTGTGSESNSPRLSSFNNDNNNHGKTINNNSSFRGSTGTVGTVTPTTVNSGAVMILTITIISANQLPKPNAATKGEIIDPYVTLTVSGAVNDHAKYSTRTIENNGFNPVWNETKTFRLTRAEVAVLSIEVMDYDPLTNNDFIAFAAMPVTCMRQGLRSCMLSDASGKREGDFAFASILLHVKLEEELKI